MSMYIVIMFLVFVTWLNVLSLIKPVFLDFKNIEDRQFMLVVKKGKVAYIDDTNEGCDSVYLMPNSMTASMCACVFVL